jgi:hypothetical protein
MNSLAKKTNQSAIRQELSRLPESIYGTYDEAMRRIGEQSEEDRSLAHRVLLWTTHASRPLTLLELQYAISIDPCSSSFNDESLEVGEILTSVCAGLVIVAGGGCVKFVREYSHPPI